MPTIELLLEDTRRELLDLSTRNRLLSVPVESKSARVIHLPNEQADDIFRLLVGDRRNLSFLPASAEKPEEPPAPAAAENPAAPAALPRAADTRLQTTLTPDGLQKRLLALYRDAGLMLEEQGVNILYLALGRLKWFEDDRSDTPRYAPLILVPVQLRRQSARERFTLSWNEDEVQENLSLSAKLDTDFWIRMPKFPTEDELVPSQYAAAVAKAVAGKTRWAVEPDAMTLGFFSFAKFLMYRDLDCRNWPDRSKLLDHPAIAGLLRDAFPPEDRPFPEDADLDELIPADRLDHVVDADGSQTQAIETVRRGRSLVIQGPPGTGKSQSITNLIASAVLEGKTVLFVAEKLAALEVVKRRLEAAGLGAICLELHSHNAHKRAVLDEIGRTWNLPPPRGAELERVVPDLERTRERLNAHARTMHEPLAPSGISPFQILGVLTALGPLGRELGEVNLPHAETWNADDLRERRALLGELAQRAKEMGTLAANPWRGARRETVLNIDLPRVQETVEALAAALPPLRAQAKTLTDALRQPEPPDFSRVELLRLMALHIAAAPTLDRRALREGVWVEGLGGLRFLVAQGREFAEKRAKLADRVTDGAWEKDWTIARSAVATHGGGFFSFLNGPYRQAMSGLRGVVKGSLPSGQTETVALFDELLAARKNLLNIRMRAETGQRAFGGEWRAENSDWDRLSSIMDWVEGEGAARVGADFHRTFSELDPARDFAALARALDERLQAAWAAAQAVQHELGLDIPSAFGCPGLEAVPFDALAERLAAWCERPEDFTRWNTWYVRARSARLLDLGAFVDAFEADGLPPGSAADVFERAYYSRLLRECVGTRPETRAELAQFDGLEHDRVVEEFRRVDADRLALAKYHVLARHHAGLPPHHAGVGGTGVLLGELQRKRGHRSVRKLLKDAGSVVQAIKPVFMMSPLSVAQFLEPGAMEFDLLIIDEASQVQPVDALGAMARASQHVVVGDSRQLPPTRFFSRLTSNDDDGYDHVPEDDADGPAIAGAKDVESILGLCCARGMPETMLRWHYRSRHQSLIAVSNHEFYEDKLFIVPSPDRTETGSGLVFRFVPDGRYDRGGTGTNAVEARAVCAAVLDHARQHPELSLGVAAFSVKQRQAILDELELARKEHPDVEAFFHAHPHEPFFVKNLENVQGDERDAIFISVGYGPDASGFMAMNFGPLSAEGGERRLNVLISRAKQRCGVFASLHAADIDLARAPGRGVQAFKSFLEFAETGRLDVAKRTGREEDSPFEEAVRRAVEGLGYEVHPQVGVAGFFVDLGVVDPAKPGRYLLGIECDGAAYHSSRSARDRDRLRQAVLEDHGWTIHRVWSTDWFQRPAEQLARVAAALQTALVEPPAPPSPPAPEAAAEPLPPTDAAPTVSAPEEDAPPPACADDALSVPYTEARFDVPPGTAPHELTAADMADVLDRIVAVEGPIHEEELITRVRELWGLKRAGGRIEESVARGVRALVAGGRCRSEERFLSRPDAPVPVRNREAVRSAGLRRVESLPPQEIRAAIRAVITACHGASAQEMPGAVARLLGFRATSTAMREAILRQIGVLTAQGILREQSGRLRLDAA